MKISRSTRRALGLLLGALLIAAGPLRATAGHSDGDRRYVGARKCGRCHDDVLMGDQQAAWRRGPHAGALDTLRGEQAAAIARAQGLDTPPSEAPECLSCHVTSHGVPPDLQAYKLKPEDGVQCESCHGPGRDYKAKNVMADADQARQRGLWDVGKRPSVCAGCHNEKSPTFDPKRYVLEDGTTTGFDFSQGLERIAHPIPNEVKGVYLELAEERKLSRPGAMSSD